MDDRNVRSLTGLSLSLTVSFVTLHITELVDVPPSV
jgi:hypothetical protein